jgi:hypothetical protein
MIDWNRINKADAQIVEKIARRAASELGVDFISTQMDLTACHTYGCCLKLMELLNAPPLDFAHDVIEISAKLNHDTGALADRFNPRYAA